MKLFWTDERMLAEWMAGVRDSDGNYVPVRPSGCGEVIVKKRRSRQKDKPRSQAKVVPIRKAR